MYCGLKEIHKIVGNKLQGGATELGSGTYGSIRTMASLPRPDKFFARTLDYIVQSQSSQETKEFSKITFVRTSIKQLGVKDYLDFITKHDDILIAKHFERDDDLEDELAAIGNMLKTIHPNVIADTTILHEEKRKGIDYFEFRCMIDVFGYRFLLYKRMQGDVDRFDPNQAPLLQRMALLYRMSVTMYTFLFHSIGNNNFHRDIKPANILYTLQKLPTGESDFEVKIGDLGLFTSSPDELIGTPNFMCVMTQPLIKDQACLRNFNGDVKLATFANEVYAYTNTLLSLCEKWKIPCEKLIKLLKTRLTAIKSPNFQKIAKEESYLYTFTEFAVYPIDIADMLGSLLKREQVIKPFGHANINIYTNSIFSNMALDELNSYMIKHKQVLPKYNNEIYLQTIGLTMKGPFAFSFVTCCYLQGVSMNNADGKDFQDILYLYLWNVSKN